MNKFTSSIALPLSFGALLLATPLDAQGKEKGKGDDRATYPAQARGDDKDSKGKAQPSSKAQRATPQAAQQRGQSAEKTKGRSDVARDSRGKQPDNSGKAVAGANSKGRGKVVSEAAGTLGAMDERGRGRFLRTLTVGDLRPNVRAFATSQKHSERFAGRAVALASLRGVNDDELTVSAVGSRVHVKNKKGDVLLDIDEDRARKMGSWKVVSLDGRTAEGSPAFCRSGAGHPVWGRQWCLDKNFGLGVENGVEWGRAASISDITLRRRTESTDLTRDVLATVLGDVVFNRLAAHAITLGYTEPLSGRWIGEANGPRILLLNSGNNTVAEIMDSNRDDRADLLLVALRAF